MNLKRCGNGHYYDGDKYGTCPHCSKNAGADDEVTVNMENTSMEREKNIPDYTETGRMTTEPPRSISLKAAVGEASSVLSRQQPEDDMRTVSYYGGSMGIEPVVGWLVCLEGQDKGKGFELKTGKNFIGRAASMDIVLEGDSSVSRERHAIVTYEPKGKKFIAQPGESRELFYLNDDVVLENIEMKQGDVLLIGKITLKFVPFCGPDFCWE